MPQDIGVYTIKHHCASTVGNTCHMCVYIVNADILHICIGPDINDCDISLLIPKPISAWMLH